MMDKETAAMAARLLPPEEARELLGKVFILREDLGICVEGDGHALGCTLKKNHKGPHAAHGATSKPHYYTLLAVWTDCWHWHYTNGFTRR